MKQRTTRDLLGAGVILTPIFFAVVAVLALVDEGFDLRMQAVSALSLGPLGWVQQVNFVLCGLLAALCAAGFGRSLPPGALRWGISTLVAVLGLGLVVAGVFSTDPAFGYPKGAPEGLPTHPSTAALIHSLAFYTAFTALTAAGFLFAAVFRKARRSGWAVYSLLSGLATPLWIGLGMAVFPSLAGIAFALAALTSLGWLSLVARQYQISVRNGEA